MSSEPPVNQISYFLQRARRVGGEILKALGVALLVWYHIPVPCASCRRPFHREAMTHLYHLPRYGTPVWRLFCAECAERLRQEAEYEGIYREENRKVQTQLRRAMDQGLPATLTTEQWLDTLDYFGDKCAYCLVAPYEALEHLVPIELGGGTTADNCVPACKSCNSAKGMRHPDQIHESSRDPAAIARVRACLMTQRPQIVASEAAEPYSGSGESTGQQ